MFLISCINRTVKSTGKINVSIYMFKFNCSADVNYEELARCTDDFNGAQLKAVCVEAVSFDFIKKLKCLVFILGFKHLFSLFV